MQGVIARVELERFTEFVDVRIALRELFARQLGCACFNSARRCEKSRDHAFGVAAGFLHSGQFEQHRLSCRQKLECASIAPGCQIELIALFGKLGQFVKRTEGGSGGRENTLPPLDPGGQRRIDILECPRCCGARDRVGGIADAREDAAGFGFTGRGVVAGLKAEEGVFEGEMQIRRFELHGLAELLAGGLAVAGLQQGVGEVFADVGTVWRECCGFLEEGDGGVVIVNAQGIECAG